MKIRQGARTVELRPQGYSKGNKLVLAGAEIHELNGAYVGFWHAGDMERNIKRELLSELAANWLPANYDRDALR